jgi:hypothetical protein
MQTREDVVEQLVAMKGRYAEIQDRDSKETYGDYPE